jgi:methylmalonyl-CoA mutase
MDGVDKSCLRFRFPLSRFRPNLDQINPKTPMADRLFEEFPDLTTADWLAQVQKDLKGMPMSRLDWEHECGIQLGAIYGQPFEGGNPGFPGMGDQRRGVQYLAQLPSGWELCQDIQLTQPAVLMERLSAIQDWPDAIRLVLPDAQKWAFAGRPAPSLLSHHSAWSQQGDFRAALHFLAEKGVKVRLQAGQSFLGGSALLLAAVEDHTCVDLSVDPLGALGVHPVPETFLDRMLADGRTVFNYVRQNLPGARPITVSLEPHALQGAHVSQQLAYALAMAVEYASDYATQGVAAKEVFASLSFHFPVSTDYFGEIARLRAFRTLWTAVLGAYGIHDELPRYTALHASGSRRQLAALDAQTNILRATTQAMSAIFGGCDSVSLPAFDELSGSGSDLGLRLASNVQRILRHESLLDRVIDPLGGAYYLEYLTEAIADQAWAHFQAIEAQGGYRIALQSGRIAAETAVSAAKKEAAIHKGKTTVLGINQYPPTSESLSARVLAEVAPGPFQHVDEAATAALLSPEKDRLAALIALIHTQGNIDGLQSSLCALLGGRAHGLPVGSRDASTFEYLRLRMAAFLRDGGRRPKAYLLTFGDLAMRKARASFTMNLLGTAAIESSENAHPDDLDASIEAAQTQAPALIVLCGADQDYGLHVPAILKTLRSSLPETVVLIAGRPPGWEEWKQDGLLDAIYAGMDRWAFLNQLLDRITGKEALHAS